MTKFIEQRVEVLENEVTELKLIIHELRGKKSIEKSTTNTVEDIIEFEGHQYKKVDREGLKGDVVIFRKNNTRFFTNGEPYKVAANGCPVDNEKEAVLPLYHDGFGRTPETVDVYELIEGGLNPQISIVDEIVEPLTPNQQRAAIIEKAKTFVKENVANGRTSGRYKDKGNSTYRNNFYDVDFFVKERKVTAVVYWLEFNEKRVSEPSNVGRAKCNPNDVFNEHIGKAIALGRALGLDVSEFEQAVQPIEIVKGMEIMLFNSDGKDHKSGVVETYNSTADEATFSAEKTYGPYAEKTGFSRCIREHGYKILNDTNAIYGGVE